MKIKKLADSVYKDFLVDYKTTVYNSIGFGEENPKPYYAYDWIEEHGLDVHIPLDRKISASDIEMKCFLVSATAQTDLATLKTYLRGAGVMVLYDDIRGIKYNVGYEGVKIDLEAFRSSKSLIAFTLKFKNISGVSV